MSKRNIFCACIFFVMTSIVYSDGGAPSVEVKGFTANEQSALPADIKNRTWTEVRSSLYDGEGGVRLFIVLPRSDQAGTGIVRTGFPGYTEWKNIAETDGGILIFPTPREGAKWDASDLAYLEAVYDHCNVGFKIEGASRYIAAYGDAGIPVSLFAVKRTCDIACAAFIQADISDINDKNIIKSNLPLAVLAVNSKDKKMAGLVDYFKTANGTDRTKKANANDVVYYRSGSSPWNADYSKSHFVRVINRKSDDYPSFIYTTLFRKVARWKTISGEGTLRGRVRAGDIPGFEKITENSTPKRTAFVYVPTGVRKRSITGPVPLVMVFHGRRCTGEYIMDQTEWFRTAEKNNFIAYAPNGFVYDWSFDTEDDHSYFSNRIDEFVKTGITVGGSTYRIDADRIYAYGFSNGSFFISQMILKYPGKLAAAALWAGGFNPSTVKGKVDKAIPVWYGIGATDHYYSEWEADWEAMMVYLIDLAGADPKNKTTKYYDAFGITNLIKTDIYTGGTVEIRQSLAPNIVHGTINEYPNYIWNDFFSKYKKQNGNSVQVSTSQ